MSDPTNYAVRRYLLTLKWLSQRSWCSSIYPSTDRLSGHWLVGYIRRRDQIDGSKGVERRRSSHLPKESARGQCGLLLVLSERAI